MLVANLWYFLNFVNSWNNGCHYLVNFNFVGKYNNKCLDEVPEYSKSVSYHVPCLWSILVVLLPNLYYFLYRFIRSVIMHNMLPLDHCRAILYPSVPMKWGILKEEWFFKDFNFQYGRGLKNSEFSKVGKPIKNLCSFHQLVVGQMYPNLSWVPCQISYF